MPVDELTLDLQELEGLSEDPQVVALAVVKVGKYALGRRQPLASVIDDCSAWWVKHYATVTNEHMRAVVDGLGLVIVNKLRWHQEIGS